MQILRRLTERGALHPRPDPLYRLQMLLTARRAAVEAASTGQRQLLAMVITAPEPVRARSRGQTTRAMITTAARLRRRQQR